MQLKIFIQRTYQKDENGNSISWIYAKDALVTTVTTGEGRKSTVAENLPLGSYYDGRKDCTGRICVEP